MTAAAVAAVAYALHVQNISNNFKVKVEVVELRAHGIA